MTYDAVNQMIAGDEAALENYAKIADSVKIMVELHHILEAMRKRRGAIDFDTVEAKIIVNEKGLPINYYMNDLYVELLSGYYHQLRYSS